MSFLRSAMNLSTSLSSPPNSPTSSRGQQQAAAAYHHDIDNSNNNNSNMMNNTGACASLIDRLAFVLVDVDVVSSSSRLQQQQQQQQSSYDHNHTNLTQIWWPAWIFETASEMFQELHLTTLHRAALMQEFFQVGRHHTSSRAQEHVAYLLTSPNNTNHTLPCLTRTVYGHPTRDFWTISDDVVQQCSEYPGWCDACLAAPEMSNCNLNGGGGMCTINSTSSPTTTTNATSSTTSLLSSPRRSSPIRANTGHRITFAVSPTTSPLRSGGRSSLYEYTTSKSPTRDYDDEMEETEDNNNNTGRRTSLSSYSTTSATTKYRRRRNWN